MSKKLFKILGIKSNNDRPKRCDFSFFMEFLTASRHAIITLILKNLPVSSYPHGVVHFSFVPLLFIHFLKQFSLQCSSQASKKAKAETFFALHKVGVTDRYNFVVISLTFSFLLAPAP